MHVQRGRGRRSLSTSMILGFAVVLAACSSSADDAGSKVGGDASVAESSIAENSVDESSAVETEVLGEVIVAEIPEVAGAPVNRFDLQVGDCFNEGSWFDEELDRRVDLTAQVDCDEPHQSEVYFEAIYPASADAQFPGSDAMTDWSTQLCYDAFEPFVGLAYELSSLEVGFVQPTRETFEHPVGLHRRVFCYVFDVNGEQKAGSMQGSGV